MSGVEEQEEPLLPTASRDDLLLAYDRLSRDVHEWLAENPA